MVDAGSIDDLEIQFDELIALLDEEDREPTPEEEEFLSELRDVIDMINSQGVIDRDDLITRKEMLLMSAKIDEAEPAWLFVDGNLEQDSWEKWRRDNGSP